jgi:hypothetical protein
VGWASSVGVDVFRERDNRHWPNFVCFEVDVSPGERAPLAQQKRPGALTGTECARSEAGFEAGYGAGLEASFFGRFLGRFAAVSAAVSIVR